jgi:hypothetical protein
MPAYGASSSFGGPGKDGYPAEAHQPCWVRWRSDCASRLRVQGFAGNPDIWGQPRFQRDFRRKSRKSSCSRRRPSAHVSRQLRLPPAGAATRSTASHCTIETPLTRCSTGTDSPSAGPDAPRWAQERPSGKASGCEAARAFGRLPPARPHRMLHASATARE